LYVDDALIYRLDGDRLRHNLDTRALEVGPHVLRIVATDAAGNTGQLELDFTISVEESTDQVTITPTAHPGPTATVEPAASVEPTDLPTRTPTATPVPAVAVFEDELTLTMYDYVPALYTDPSSGLPYPLLNHDQVGPPVNRTFRTIVLRNEYLEVTILPELGGRIYQCRFVPTGQPLLYNNPVIKPTHWGPPEMGWWLAVGGIEFALPVEEHGYLTAQPWEASVAREGDGSATVVLQILEKSRGLYTRVEVTLRPGEAAIHVAPSIRNDSGSSQQFQFWTNAMLSPGRHGVGPEAQIAFPADQVIVHSRGDLSLPPEGATMPWPVYAGRNLSSYGEWQNWLGFFGPERWAPYMGLYDQATEIGMVHSADPAVLPGAKVFGPGRDFDTSVYSDDGAHYIELWSGITPTFGQSVILPAGASLAWGEIWYVVSQSEGITVANEHASLHVWGEQGVIRLTVASPAAHRWRMLAQQHGVVLEDLVFDVQPDLPYRATLPQSTDPGAPLDVQILDLEGDLVLEHVY